jgi:hypothetical protein
MPRKTVGAVKLARQLSAAFYKIGPPELPCFRDAPKDPFSIGVPALRVRGNKLCPFFFRRNEKQHFVIFQYGAIS